MIAHWRRRVVDDRCERERSRRAGEADEIAIVGLSGHDVEARQAQRDADEKQERERAAEVAEDLQSPGVDEDGGRATERHDIGERVVLFAELARRRKLPGEESVERVEDRREKERQTGDFEEVDRQVGAAVDDGLDSARAVDDRSKSEEQIQARE